MGITYDSSPIPIEQNIGHHTYSATDSSMLELSGSQNDFEKEYIEINFELCVRSESLECAEEEEVRKFLANSMMNLVGF